ncbi:nitroreductase family protein [Amycolatopsis sp. BJA-103]|uniref:nitroreductase family protein n=1 Tax=unclassified Amycolatopsis TaxID=2618356 RepID=UPI000C764748|nr:nitroreductase family protein [Amycolatopsis sp. BJA-103]AUI60278.1 nitroreductase [Amycolatopsis sp. BJA-103]
MILTDSPVLATALEAAVRAPSPHNTQPWFFELEPGVVELYLDEDRVLEVCDPDGREARLACGAALLNIELAIAAAGWFPDTDLMPDRTRPSLLARVEIGDRHRPSAGDLRRADHLQTQDDAFQAEMRSWTSAHDRDDGVPAFAGGPRSAGGLLPVRHFHDSDAPRSYERDPVVAVLTTPDEGPVAQLRAGRAMQRVLLTATMEGLSASFYSQPMEIPSARAELRALLGGTDYPQTLFRLGYGFPGVPTPRRPPGAVVRAKAS